MRVDLFLKLAGLLRTRSIAEKACEGGFVSVNGRAAKPSSRLKPGDEVSVMLPDGRTVVFSVKELPAGRSVPKSERASLFSMISEEAPGP